MHMAKPILWLLCLCTAMPFGAKAQSTRTYMFNFHKNDFTVETLNGDTCCLFSSNSHFSSECNPMLPDLPFFNVTILLPKNTEYVGFTYNKTSSSFLKNIVLTNGKTPFALEQVVESSNTEWYPNILYLPTVEYVETTNIGDFHMVTFKVQPCKFSPSSKKMFFYNISLTIELCSTQPSSTTHFIDSREIDYIKELIWQSDSLEAWYGQTISENITEDTPESGVYDITKDKYYIITTEGLKRAFQPLIDWKMFKGLDGEIITTSQIYQADQSSDPDYLKIKKYLRNKYVNDPVPGKKNYYVLLGGDVDSVPTAYCISPEFTNPYSQHLNGELIPCDMYYSCLDGVFDWDGNHNGLLGEQGDGVSFLTKLLVGRASVSTESQVKEFINKVIKYEKYPPISTDWGNSILLCGSMGYNKMFLGDDTTTIFLENSVSDLDTISRKIAAETILPYWHGNVNYFFDSSSNLYSTTDQQSGSGGYTSRDRLAQQLRNNFSLVYESSHGGYNYWQIGSNTNSTSRYTTDNADTLTSKYPKIILTSSCYTNGFDQNEQLYGPSMSESLMRNPNSGVVAYIGSSREGFTASKKEFESNNYIVHSHIFDYCFLKSLYAPEQATLHYKDKKEGHLAKLIDEARLQSVKKINDTDDGKYYKRLIYSINMLGDPEMSLYKDSPKLFNHVRCTESEGVDGSYNISLSIDSIEGSFYICTKEDNVYSPLWMCDSYDVFETEIIDDSIEIVVTKQGYKPLYLKIFKTAYIQNQTIQENISYISNYSNIFVGRNVTDTVPYGPVQIESGKKLILKPKKEIMIKNSFEVPLGAEFEMDISN